MTYRGKIKDGVVVIEGDLAPAEGTEVIVREVSEAQAQTPEDQPTASEVLLKFAGTMNAGDLPADGAENHDHYIYGAPKR